MKKVRKKLCFLHPVLVGDRWYAAEYKSGKIVYETSFTMKCLAEMFCANMMGLKVNEARFLWELIEIVVYKVVA